MNTSKKVKKKDQFESMKKKQLEKERKKEKWNRVKKEKGKLFLWGKKDEKKNERKYK